MSANMQLIEVQKIKKSTDDCTIVTFKVDEARADELKFKQGQYLTLETTIDGEKVRRSYSLCTSPLDNEWSVAIKKVDGGKFSTYANEKMKVGDQVMMMKPDGKFYTDIEPNKEKHYIAFAAGSGITPILSIIKTHLALEPKSTFQLFYVNQSVGTIILKEEIEGLKNKYMDRFEIFHFLTREFRSTPLFNGRLDKEKLDEIFDTIVDKNNVSDAFICGPMNMIFLIRDYLKDQGLDTKHIHYELFGTEKVPHKKDGKVDAQGDSISNVTIIEGGKSMNITISKGNENILDAALRNNADLPYACKGGVCSTCRAKLIEGKVDMEVAYGLEQDEIDNGYILTCQAVPKSDKVVVDFEV